MGLLDRKLLFYGGKGGVGKTSCAAAAGLYAASKGKKVLVLSTDPAHSLADSFDTRIGNTITRIRENLDGLEIDAGQLLKDYKATYGELIKQIADEGTFFSKEDIQQFFDLSLPGMDELMALFRVIEILEEDRYDLLIIDTAPTGHTIRLLELPDLMRAYVKVLAEMRQKHRVVVSMMTGRYVKDRADEFIEKMHHDIEGVRSLLRDRIRTAFIPVTIPEAMSISETERLVRFLEKQGIAIGEILVNCVMAGNCGFCTSKRAEQERYLKEIRQKFNYRMREIPLFPTEVRGKNLEVLSRILFNEDYVVPEPAVKPGPGVQFEALRIGQKLEFLLFGGKGGVGKTVMASAVALHESKSRKVMLFSTDPAHSLSDSFGLKIGNTVTRIGDNLDALEIDAYSLLNTLKARYKREIEEFFSSIFQPAAGGAVHGTIDAPYDRRVMTDLFDLAPPGIDEIMAFKTMMELMAEKKYDLFILDTAPSGHTIRLLELPEIAEEWVSTLSGILEQYPLQFETGDTLKGMLETIRDFRSMLAAPDKTEFIPVAIPEAMSVMETEDLLTGLKRLRVPVRQLIVNKLTPESGSGCGLCAARRAEQLGHARRLQQLGLRTQGIDLFPTEVRGMQGLERVAALLFGPAQDY